MEKSNKKNQRTKRNIIVSAVLAILLCIGIIVGATFALFTSEDKVNVSVTSGNVEIKAKATDYKTYSGVALTGDASKDVIEETETLGVFTNGGTAVLSDDGKTLTLERMTPGDKVTFDMTLTNHSNIITKYRLSVSGNNAEGSELFNVLSFEIVGLESAGYTAWNTLEAVNDIVQGAVIGTYPCYVELPSDVNNDYQNMSCTIEFNVEQVQGNAATVDAKNSVFEIDNVADLMYFQEHASEISGLVKLMTDIDLDGADWTPIDWYAAGGKTFDGNNKTVSNFVVNVQGSAGFFSHIRFVKNLKIDKATITGTKMVGGIVGNGEVSEIENCSVTNSTITANVWWDSTKNNGAGGYEDGNNVGGIVGYLSSSDADACVTNCTVSGCTIQGYRDMGGLIGTRTKYNGDVTVTGNTISGVILSRDVNGSHNYQEYMQESQYNVNDVIGRALDGDGTGTLTTEDNHCESITKGTYIAPDEVSG